MATATKSRTTSVVTLSIGFLCLLVTVALGLNIGGAADMFPTAGKAVWGFGGCAVALLICSIASWLHKPTSSELVSEADERNIAIRSQAAEKAFTLLSVLVPIGALALFVSDQLSVAGVLIMIGLEVVAFLGYLLWIAKIQRSM